MHKHPQGQQPRELLAAGKPNAAAAALILLLAPSASPSLVDASNWPDRLYLLPYCGGDRIHAATPDDAASVDLARLLIQCCARTNRAATGLAFVRRWWAVEESRPFSAVLAVAQLLLAERRFDEAEAACRARLALLVAAGGGGGGHGGDGRSGGEGEGEGEDGALMAEFLCFHVLLGRDAASTRALAFLDSGMARSLLPEAQRCAFRASLLAHYAALKAMGEEGVAGDGEAAGIGAAAAAAAPPVPQHQQQRHQQPSARLAPLSQLQRTPLAAGGGGPAPLRFWWAWGMSWMRSQRRLLQEEDPGTSGIPAHCEFLKQSSAVDPAVIRRAGRGGRGTTRSAAAAAADPARPVGGVAAGHVLAGALSFQECSKFDI